MSSTSDNRISKDEDRDNKNDDVKNESVKGSKKKNPKTGKVAPDTPSKQKKKSKKKNAVRRNSKSNRSSRKKRRKVDRVVETPKVRTEENGQRSKRERERFGDVGNSVLLHTHTLTSATISHYTDYESWHKLCLDTVGSFATIHGRSRCGAV